MKKLTTLLIVAVFITSLNINAQSMAFDKGKTVATIGYGVPNLTRTWLRFALSAYPNYHITGFGPCIVKGEYGVLPGLGIGAVIGFSSTKVTYDESGYYYSNGYGYNQMYTYQESLAWTSLSLGAHANYHFLRKEKIDVYFGGGLGYTLNTFTYTNNDPYYSNNNSTLNYNPMPLFFSSTIGMRYFFTPNIGIYAEAGIEKGAILQGGLALKF